MSDSELKVTDKRPFTPEGELREEHREHQQASRRQGAGAERLPPPTLLDLIGLLAETAAACLSEERPSPPLARFHIDLLEVVRGKTQGNLEASEQAALDDALYRLRMLYVEKTTAR